MSVETQTKYPGVPKWELPLLKPEQHPTALQVIQHEHVSLRNKTVFVTGGSSGIGVETVRALASAGARVFVLARSVDRTQVTLDKISAEFPQHGGLEIVQGELDSLSSVNAAANNFLKRSSQLNILINNAGIFHAPFELTKDGFESQLAIDHIAHHLLFKKLASLLLKSSTPHFHSRVVVVASAVHLSGEVDFNDINYTQGRKYDPSEAYSQAKLANVWFANHLEKLYGKQGLHGLSLHPGMITTDNVRSKMLPDFLVHLGMFDASGEYLLSSHSKSIEQGAATTVWAAVTPELEGKGALYLEDAAIAKPNVPGEFSGYSATAFEEDKAAKLWDWTEAAIAKFVQP